jgi:hypothetical protein
MTMTTEERFEVLSALLDREAVDPDALARALDDPAGRTQLVDFARLRARVQQEFAVDDAVTTAPRPSSARRWLARAALVLLPLSLGLLGGAWWVEQRELRPPTPDVVVRLVPGVDWK